MDTLSLGEGFRFYPTDQEIIRFLEMKRLDPGFSVHTILEANIYGYEPNQLFELPAIRFDEKWCNFYCAPSYMNGNGDRVNRAAGSGYWKITGKPREIKAKRSNKVIGSKRTLVFYERRPRSKEIRTSWVMREFTVEHNPDFKKDFVLCRIKRKKEKKRRLSTKNEDRRVKKPRASINDERQPSHHVTYDNGNHIVGDISLESQLLPNHHLDRQFLSSCDSISNSRNHVAENVSLESPLISSCDSISHRNHVAEIPEDISQDPILANSNELNGCSNLDQTSFWALLSPIHQVQGSSYPGVAGNDCDALNAPLGNEWDDSIVNPQLAVPDEYSHEETGNSARPLDFNSSKSAGECCRGNSNDSDTENFNEWVSVVFGNYTSDASLNDI